MFEQINERQQEHLFKKLLSKPENSFCADCKAKGASWTSMTYGVFICINCSGIHRSFGLQVTRVRSTKLDNWTKADAKIMEVVGNKVANLYWEHQIIYHKKDQTFSDDNKVDFIKQKYLMKAFVKKDGKNPVDVLIEKNYKATQEELLQLYENTSNAMQNDEKTPKKKFEFIKQKKNRVTEDIDLLGFDENAKQISVKTNISCKIGHKDMFDLDFNVDLASIATDSKIKQKPSNNDDMFFMDLTDDTLQLRKSHSTVETHKSVATNAHHVYNIHNLNIYNASTNNVVNSVNNQPQNDKYSVFDVYKLYNAPMYKY